MRAPASFCEFRASIESRVNGVKTYARNYEKKCSEEFDNLLAFKILWTRAGQIRLEEMYGREGINRTICPSTTSLSWFKICSAILRYSVRETRVIASVGKSVLVDALLMRSMANSCRERERSATARYDACLCQSPN